VTFLDHPFRFDARGRTAETATRDHVRDLVEQVLFTSPGERVNRPTFGSGVMQLVFAPASEELTTVTQFLVQGALQQWVGELVELGTVDVEVRDSELAVTVVYKLRRTGAQETVTLTRTLG
jgi:phage baseplate assembly protein W